MDIAAETKAYEVWLAAAIPAPLYGPDLDYRHGRMADPADPFPFFRGTYYLWAKRWPADAGDLAGAPAVLAVGDLHVENFGTWRDADGRLCWGINDFDEADELPYTQDLVRLAASARLAHRAGALNAKLEPACESLLAGYRECMEGGGRPFVLEENHPVLRALASTAERDPARFWAKMAKLLAAPAAEPPAEARAAVVSALPPAAPAAEFRVRPQAGMGSLGRPRYVAMLEWNGGRIAREVKAAAPPATAWAAGRPGRVRMAEALGRAVRSPDPFYRPNAQWIVRRLAPQCSRIELAPLSADSAVHLLHGMGAETANVHLGTPGAAAAIRKDLAGRTAGWLEAAARATCDRVEKDWEEWRRGRA